MFQEASAIEKKWLLGHKASFRISSSRSTTDDSKKMQINLRQPDAEFLPVK